MKRIYIASPYGPNGDTALGEIVLTPFMGVGSEIYSAVQNNRIGLGIELKPTYYHQAIRNLEAVDVKEPKELTLFDLNDSALFGND